MFICYDPGMITQLHVHQLQGSSRDDTDPWESDDEGKDKEIKSP